MKLYYTPGTCSLAPHIVAREAGLEFSLEQVDLCSGKTATGIDFKTINPKGYVPALCLENGQVLTEGPAIMQYLADLKPGSGLAAATGTFERYRLQEWLTFINSEVHRAYSPLFKPETPDVIKPLQIGALHRRYAYLDPLLEGKAFLTGNDFTVADAYLFVVTTWASEVQLDLSAFKNVMAFQARVAARAAVRAAMIAEGLVN